jgi:hypothetical protein
MVLGFTLIVFDIMKKTSSEPSSSVRVSKFSKYGYIFGILALITMSFLSIGYL